MSEELTLETYIRHLPHGAVLRLANHLDTNNFWELLAAVIPKTPDEIFNLSTDNFHGRYTMAHINCLKDKNLRPGGSSTKSLIHDWSTQNCRIKHLIFGLLKADLIVAAQFMAEEVLQIEPHEFNQLRQTLIRDPRMVCARARSSKSADSSMSCPTYGLPEHLEPMPDLKSMPETTCTTELSVTTSTGTRADSISDFGDGEKGCQVGAAAPWPTPSTQPAQGKDLEELAVSLEELNHLREIRYDLLSLITNNFNVEKYRDGGNVIGEGGFGTVFLGTFNNGYKVAIKCLKDNSEDSKQQFKTEVETLTRFKHENLVFLLGYSADGDNPRCLVYQYMPNGSLEERLACQYETPPLSNSIRLEIAQGTACGIKFLHEQGLVHRDIKSANILLDAEYKAKVGDFATARVLPPSLTTQVMKASVVIGTAAYLAPEAVTFAVRPSLDVYSYGVVILEILTGLPVMDHEREEVDLKTYVQEHCYEGDVEDDDEPGTIFDLLDKRGGDWNRNIVETLYSLSCRCLEQRPKKRPKMTDILAEIDATLSTADAPV